MKFQEPGQWPLFLLMLLGMKAAKQSEMGARREPHLPEPDWKILAGDAGKSVRKGRKMVGRAHGQSQGLLQL